MSSIMSSSICSKTPPNSLVKIIRDIKIRRITAFLQKFIREIQTRLYLQGKSILSIVRNPTSLQGNFENCVGHCYRFLEASIQKVVQRGSSISKSTHELVKDFVKKFWLLKKVVFIIQVFKRMGTALSICCPTRAERKAGAVDAAFYGTPDAKGTKRSVRTPPNTLQDLKGLKPFPKEMQLDDEFEAELHRLAELKKRSESMKTELMESMEVSRRGSRAISEVSTPCNRNPLRTSLIGDGAGNTAVSSVDNTPLPKGKINIGDLKESEIKISEDMRVTMGELENSDGAKSESATPTPRVSHVSLPDDNELLRILNQQLDEEATVLGSGPDKEDLPMVPKMLSPVDECDTTENSWEDEHSSTQEANSSSAADNEYSTSAVDNSAREESSSLREDEKSLEEKTQSVEEKTETLVDEKAEAALKNQFIFTIVEDDTTAIVQEKLQGETEGNDEIPREKSAQMKLGPVTDFSFDASDDEEEEVDENQVNEYLDEEPELKSSPVLRGLSDPTMLPPSAFGVWFNDVVKPRYHDKLAIYRTPGVSSSYSTPSLPLAGYSDTDLLNSRSGTINKAVRELSNTPQKAARPPVEFVFNGSSYSGRDRRRETFGGRGLLGKFQAK